MSEKNWPFSSKNFVPVVLALLSLALRGGVFASDLGKSGGAALEKIPDAKALALAESIGALDGGAHGVFVNPATLGTLEAPELAANILRGFSEDNLASVTYAHPTKAGTLAMWIAHYNAGELDLQFGDGSNRTLDAQRDTIAALAYSIDWLNRGAVGLNVKFFNSEIAEEAKGTAVLMDIGVFQKNLLPSINAGAFVRNAGSRIKYESGNDPAPRIIGLALGFDREIARSLDLRLGLSGTTNTAERSSGVQSGVELLMKRLLALRVGIKKESVSTTTLESLTFGVGFQLERLRLDYAIVPSDEIPEQTHAITVLYGFK